MGSSATVFKQYSTLLRREMSVARWGHFGIPVLLFPTAAADCLDNERFKLIWKIQPFIDRGLIKVYSCESVNGDSWLSPTAHPLEKSRLQAQYDRYLLEELLPAISQDCAGVRGMIAAGASLGAYNALTVTTKHPEWFRGCIAMSGTYDFDRWMDGHVDQNYYYNQPMYYLGNMTEGTQLQRIRQNTMIVASGTGRYEAPDESERIVKLLHSKGVHNAQLELWGPDAHHDWPTWRTMLPNFLARLI